MPENSIAIVDIGSNSVRLVVYAGAARIPAIIFNEKVMAGLGRDLPASGALSAESQERALSALRRFHLLTRQMGVRRARVVATAAVREASNGQAFLREVAAIGFRPEVLSGEEEAAMAGQGVLSAIPGADGIVGDLGGGSLELVDLREGGIAASVSLPLGVLRISALADKREGALARKLAKALDGCDFRKRGRKRPFYLVGGSWRAVARLDMLVENYPLPITQHYQMGPERPAALQRSIEGLDRLERRNIPSVSFSRVPTLAPANALLKALCDELKPSTLITSSFGIREGLLFNDLDSRTRAQDPLVEAAREAGRGLGRFSEHGALLDRWIAPVFDDPPELARLRLAACLLADVAWRANPDFRAERGVDMALHGNWVGVDGPGRVMMAQALFSNFGGGGNFGDMPAASLCNPRELKQASQWGLAMRLGQRLSGGVAASLERSRLVLKDGVVRLELKRGDEALFGEIVERRLNSLASALGYKSEAVAV